MSEPLVHTGQAIGWYRCDGKDCPVCGPPPEVLTGYAPHRIFFCEECQEWTCSVHTHKKKKATSLPSKP